MNQYLLDTSAFWQGRINTSAGERIRDLGKTEALVACTPAILEMLYGARNSREWATMRGLFDGIPRVDLADSVSAIDLQGALARRGQHRTPIVDILVAATAAEHGLTVLHYDREFERLSELTGGTHEWVIPPAPGIRCGH